jgi:adenylate kinase family enzyme
LAEHPHAMRRVAVFGNAGGGKSTLSRRLAEITGLPLYIVDRIQFPGGRYRPEEKGGGKIAHQEYVEIHKEILGRDSWIIDGFDSVALAWERFAAADTLVHVDLHVLTHYWGVTKRLVAGQFRNPMGWPENTPVWESSLDSYRVVWRCHRRLTPKYRRLVGEAASMKCVHHLRSRAEMRAFLQATSQQQAQHP